MSVEDKLSDPGDLQLTEVLSETAIFQFKIGMKIEVEYVNPTAGWTVIWLMDIFNNVVLTFSARICQGILALNTRIDNKWGKEVRPKGYDFTPGVSQNVCFEAEENYFIIQVNNNDLNHYAYRLPVTSIRKVMVQYRKAGDAAASKLNAVSYKY